MAGSNPDASEPAERWFPNAETFYKCGVCVDEVYFQWPRTESRLGMWATPMTAIVILVILCCVVGGALLFLYSLVRQAGEGSAKVCRRCQKPNPAHARFCGHCGQRLS